MKILALDLIAYGRFQGLGFDLSAGAEGLHILYGPNEAGKSTALRALDALLFGVESRTPDAFRHPYDRLRVGGCLRTAAGDELRVIRRKGNKNTLRAEDDTTVVDDAKLDRALGGITRETFRLLFGIDHEALVRGGRDILEQRGDVGQALFGTALGTAGLHRLLAELDAEAKSLFLPSGSKPPINQTLRQFKEATRQVNEHSLKTSRWVEADRAFRDAEAALAAVKAELSAARARHSGWERVRNTLPFVLRRATLAEALAAAGDPVRLPDGFAESWARGLDARRAARDTLRLRQPQLQQLTDEIAALSVPQGLLDQGETIEGFHQELGGHHKAERDLPIRRREREAALDRARRVLAAVRPDLAVGDAEVLRGLLGREAKLQALARAHSQITQRAETARTEARDAARDQDRCQAALAALPAPRDATPLRQAVDRAKRGGDLDTEIDRKARGIADREADLTRRLGALGVWPGSLEGLAASPLPQSATVDRFEKEWAALERRLERNREGLAEAAAEVARQARELDAIAAAGSVPTEGELLAQRARRQTGWALVRARWIEGQEIGEEARGYAPDGDLPGAYEAAVAEADEVADRLRREARRVQQKAAALAGCGAAERRREELGAEAEELAAARSEMAAAWAAVWAPCGIDPLGPAEMRGWLARAGQLLERREELAQARAELTALEQTRTTLQTGVVLALAELGETAPPGGYPLAPLLAHAEAWVERLERAARDRAEAEKGLAAAETRAADAAADRTAADEDLRGWRSRWAPLVAELNLPGDTEPEEALGALGQVRELFGHLDEAAALAARIASMADDLEGFGRRLRAFCQRSAPDLVTWSPAEGVAELNARLKAGLEARARKQGLEDRRDELATEVREAAGNLEAAEAELAEGLAVAGCTDEDGVADRIDRHRRQRDLTGELQEVEGRILDLGDGLPLSDLLAEARGVDADALKADLAQLHTEIRELEDRQAEALEARTRARTELDRMDGSGAAAAAALEAQEHLTLLGAQVERYARARLAHRVLRDEIQRYREENEGPLLKRAGEIFGRLSLGSFSSLRVDYHDDAAVLVGERPDRGRTPVEGMSTGTRDQLYLALRLAAVERSLTKNEPLPFIVDDILVNFDDRRSQATLQILAELALQTQVIVFSHHRGIVELAQGMDGGAGVFVHQGWNGDGGA